VLRTLLKGAIVGAGACFLLAACAPVKIGAAAIVGNQRITLAQLDTQVAALSDAAKSYPGQVQLTQAEIPGKVLTWLIRFDILNQMASDHGISVTSSETESALVQINDEAEQEAEQEGESNFNLTSFLAANGIPPTQLQQVGQYEAIEIAYIEQVNGGKLPSAAAAENAASAKLNQAQCAAAKSLNIQVSPQFGQFDYSTYTVNAAPDSLSLPSGTVATASNSGAASSC
jgi:hypothetical protein